MTQTRSQWWVWVEDNIPIASCFLPRKQVCGWLRAEPAPCGPGARPCLLLGRGGPPGCPPRRSLVCFCGRGAPHPFGAGVCSTGRARGCSGEERAASGTRQTARRVLVGAGQPQPGRRFLTKVAPPALCRSGDSRVPPACAPDCLAKSRRAPRWGLRVTRAERRFHSFRGLAPAGDTEAVPVLRSGSLSRLVCPASAGPLEPLRLRNGVTGERTLKL